MKRLAYLIVLVLIILSYPVSSIAQLDDVNMKRTRNYLKVYSEDRNSSITVDMNKDLINIDLGSLTDIGCESGYCTDISFKFDLTESFGIPFYCSESEINLIHSFEPYFVKKLIYHLKKYYVLRILIPGRAEIITFDLVGFIYLYNTNF